MPARWGKPLVQVGAVPAHAQASLCFGMLIELESESPANFSYNTLIGDDPIFVSESATTATYGWSCGSGCLAASILVDQDYYLSATFFGGNSSSGPLSANTVRYAAINLDTLSSGTGSNSTIINGLGCGIE